MCTVVLSFEPASRIPLLLLAVRVELTDRPWLPPARHWRGSPLLGGIDEQAGGTWLAVHPGVPRVACLLNGPGSQADKARRRSRGELPLRVAADGAWVLKELAGDSRALAAYDPFHLLCADTGGVRLLSWDGAHPACQDLEPGTHLVTNTGPAYPDAPAHPVTEPRARHFGPKFAATRPPGDPALPIGQAWGDWLTLAAGEGLDPGDPRAILTRRLLPDDRVWGATSLSLVALAADGRLRYDFQPQPGATTGWYPVDVAAEESGQGMAGRQHAPSTRAVSRNA